MLIKSCWQNFYIINVDGLFCNSKKSMKKKHTKIMLFSATNISNIMKNTGDTNYTVWKWLL